MTEARQGIEFPLATDGTRSSTELNKTVWSDSAKAVSSQLAADILKEPKWRFRYTKYAELHLKESLKAPGNALATAEAGLESLYQKMLFVSALMNFRIMLNKQYYITFYGLDLKTR